MRKAGLVIRISYDPSLLLLTVGYRSKRRTRVVVEYGVPVARYIVRELNCCAI